MLAASAAWRGIGLDELVQHDRRDQSGGADNAQQLQQREGFTGCSRDLLRSHGVFLKVGKTEMVHGSEAGASRLAQTRVGRMPLSLLDRPEFPTGWRWTHSPPCGKPAYEKAASPVRSDTAFTIAATAFASSVNPICATPGTIVTGTTRPASLKTPANASA